MWIDARAKNTFEPISGIFDMFRTLRIFRNVKAAPESQVRSERGDFHTGFEGPQSAVQLDAATD
jgi:hypothetical protein